MHLRGLYAFDGPRSEPFGFSGQFGAYDDGNATGLVLMGFRDYEPQTGWFLTKDPIGYAGGLNLYAYTGNNPVNYIVP